MPDPPGLPKLQEGLVAAREWLDKAQVRRSWRRQAGAAPVLEPSLQRFSIYVVSPSPPFLDATHHQLCRAPVSPIGFHVPIFMPSLPYLDSPSWTRSTPATARRSSLVQPRRTASQVRAGGCF